MSWSSRKGPEYKGHFREDVSEAPQMSGPRAAMQRPRGSVDVRMGPGCADSPGWVLAEHSVESGSGQVCGWLGLELASVLGPKSEVGRSLTKS